MFCNEDFWNIVFFELFKLFFIWLIDCFEFVCLKDLFFGGGGVFRKLFIDLFEWFLYLFSIDDKFKEVKSIGLIVMYIKVKNFFIGICFYNVFEFIMVRGIWRWED